MKIGVVTFWWSDENYGQLLQCYALQKYLRDKGHDVYLIRYDPRGDTVKTPLYARLRKALRPLAAVRVWRAARERVIHRKIDRLNKRRDFDGFRKTRIRQSEKIYRSYRELAAEPPEADMYIVGSDQVWNPDFLMLDKTDARARAYCLDFGAADVKRAAWAASFGKERVDEAGITTMTSFLKRFEFISAREQSGAALLRRAGFPNAAWAPDPTMLLPVEAYRELYAAPGGGAAGSVVPRGPYCLLYLLGNQCDFRFDYFFKWARDNHYETVYVSGNYRYDRRRKIYATIPEWLALVEGAGCVITNSFHCGVFCLLYGTNFGIAPLCGKDAGMNERFVSLFALFGMEARFVAPRDYRALQTPLDRAAIQERFETLREDANHDVNAGF